MEMAEGGGVPHQNGYMCDLVARINNACVRIKDGRHELRRATLSTLQRVHKCIEAGGTIFENLL